MYKYLSLSLFLFLYNHMNHILLFILLICDCGYSLHHLFCALMFNIKTAQLLYVIEERSL